MISTGGMMAVAMGGLPWLRPSPAVVPPWPPPKKLNITQRLRSVRWPVSDRALMVP